MDSYGEYTYVSKKGCKNMTKQQFGVIGLAVMGKNLAMNIESRGYSVSVFNRSRKKQMKFSRNKRPKHYRYLFN